MPLTEQAVRPCAYCHRDTAENALFQSACTDCRAQIDAYLKSLHEVGFLTRHGLRALLRLGSRQYRLVCFTCREHGEWTEDWVACAEAQSEHRARTAFPPFGAIGTVTA